MPDAPRHRRPFGIFEAALLLVTAGAAVWLARPVPGARAAAAAETEVLRVLDALADAEDALPPASRYLPLPALRERSPAAAAALAGFAPSPVPGVAGNGTYWVAVLLPDRDGVVRAPGREDPASAGRGYVVVAWPRAGASPLLRSLAALPGNGAWQRADGMDGPGDPARPPVPATAFPAVPAKEAPPPPLDWVRTGGLRQK